MCKAFYNDGGEVSCVCRRDDEHQTHIGICGDDFVLWTDAIQSAADRIRRAIIQLASDTASVVLLLALAVALVMHRGVTR